MLNVTELKQPAGIGCRRKLNVTEDQIVALLRMVERLPCLSSPLVEQCPDAIELRRQASVIHQNLIEISHCASQVLEED